MASALPLLTSMENGQTQAEGYLIKYLLTDDSELEKEPAEYHSDGRVAANERTNCPT
ncbi:MAG: hypothetical protein HQ580_07205 [Planctomycetes bacterium]|nr:hypothetical protein [Planctomycetota bacterium]